MTPIDDATTHLEIERTIFRLGRSLDERDFEALRDLFTPDASVSTPGGTATGHDALVEQARRRHSDDDGIQHVITNVLIDRTGERATVRANLIVAFARTGPADPAPFLLGEVYRFEFVRTSAGWLISRLSSAPTWTLNRPVDLAARLAGPRD